MGYENILVIIDHFTKFAQAYLAKNQKAVTMAKLVLDFIRRYGFPEKFHPDQGQNFVGKVMKNLYKLTGIKQTTTTPYLPMGNGLSERFNHTLLSMFGTLTSEKKKAWPKYLPDLVMAYNLPAHDSTDFSPYFLMFGRQPRLPVDVVMGITLEDDNEDFIKNQQEIFRTAYDIASRKVREAGQKQKKYYDKGRAKKASDFLTVGTQVLVKRTGFQERHKIADIREDDVYVIMDQPHKDIPVYTVENQTDKIVKTVHRNLLLPLPTVLDWMRPFDPNTLVKPVSDNNDANEEELDDDQHSDIDDSDGDSDLSGDEPICLRTRSQRKTPESPSDDDTNNDDDRSDVTIEEPIAQEIEKQSDSDSYKSADSGSDGEDGCVGIHSPPLAQRKSARQRKLPAKYDGFIIGPLKQLSVILEMCV